MTDRNEELEAALDKVVEAIGYTQAQVASTCKEGHDMTPPRLLLDAIDDLRELFRKQAPEVTFTVEAAEIDLSYNRQFHNLANRIEAHISAREDTRATGCLLCHGEGSYWEDVAGDGGGRMQVACECQPDEEEASLSAPRTDIGRAEDISKAIAEGKHWKKVAFAALAHLKAPQIRAVADKTGIQVTLCGEINELLQPQAAPRTEEGR